MARQSVGPTSLVPKLANLQLQLLRLDRRSLRMLRRRWLAHSTVLDYCNSLLAGVTSGLLTKLQSVQNAAARFVSMSWKFDHIMLILHDLHWLPVHKNINFKVATLVYKCLLGCASPYLAEDCVLVASLSGRQHLRSADTCKLFVPKTSTNYGSRSFLVHGPNSWNSLPAELRLIDNLTTFCRKLKTFLFSL